MTRVGDSRIVYTNPAFDAMFGYPSGELIGVHFNTLNAGDNTARLRISTDINRALAKEGSWSGQVLNVRKDGSTFQCLTQVSTFDHPTLGPVWVGVHSRQ